MIATIFCKELSRTFIVFVQFSKNVTRWYKSRRKKLYLCVIKMNKAKGNYNKNKMSKSPKDRLSEIEVKLILGDWFTNLGFQIFDEKKNKNRPQWSVFEVKNVDRRKKPDLAVCGNFKQKL